MKSTVLCIEGKFSGTPLFSEALENKGYKIKRENTGKAALKSLENKKPLVTVINAPSMRTTGLRICSSIRKKHKKLPIFLICEEGTSYGNNEVEADLVLPLPFTIRKLHNRIKPLLPSESKKILKAGCLNLDKERLLVKCKGRETKITPKAADLLVLLMKNAGKVIERTDLFSKVWETDFTDDTRTLDVHISWLRQAIEKDPRNPKILITLRGHGYRLDV
jgi:DNA-binding response OmpR family regulator